MKKSIIAIFLVVIMFFGISFAGRGCCSWHGGQAYCGSNGMRQCNDGTQSPTCSCSVSTYTPTYAPTVTPTVIPTCGLNSHLSNGSCYCDIGYTWENPNSKDNLNCVSRESLTELTNAISRMYGSGLTRYGTLDTFLGNDYITREQASKFFVSFAWLLGKEDDTSIYDTFDDIDNATPDLVAYIKFAYRMGLIKGTNNKFMPYNNLTRAQALAILIRITNGMQNEYGLQWYSEYFDIAFNYGVIDYLGFTYNTLDSTNIKRSEVALLLYRLNNYLHTSS